MCQKALAITEQVLGKQHLDTATSYNNMGLTLGELERRIEIKFLGSV